MPLWNQAKRSREGMLDKQQYYADGKWTTTNLTCVHPEL